VETEALVDTGATRLYLQSSLIKTLGLRKESEVQSKTTNGVRRRAVFESVRLDLMGRNGAFQVVEGTMMCQISWARFRWNISTSLWITEAKNSFQIRNTGQADERGVLMRCVTVVGRGRYWR